MKTISFVANPLSFFANTFVIVVADVSVFLVASASVRSLAGLVWFIELLLSVPFYVCRQMRSFSQHVMQYRFNIRVTTAFPIFLYLFSN